MAAWHARFLTEYQGARESMLESLGCMPLEPLVLSELPVVWILVELPAFQLGSKVRLEIPHRSKGLVLAKLALVS